jgi:hypothetical protein
MTIAPGHFVSVTDGQAVKYYMITGTHHSIDSLVYTREVHADIIHPAMMARCRACGAEPGVHCADSGVPDEAHPGVHTERGMEDKP